jgi:hypothetical protein
MEGNVFSRMLSIAVLVMACFALAACGGGDSTTGGDSGATSADTEAAANSGDETSADSGSTEAPTVNGPSLKKAEYIAKGDAICEKVPQGYQPLFAKVTKELEKEEKAQKRKIPSKEKEEETNLKAAVPPLHTAVEEFGKLGSPKGDEEIAQEVVDALQAAVDGLEADPSLPLTGKGSPFEEFVKVTQGYGFKFCPQL